MTGIVGVSNDDDSKLNLGVISRGRSLTEIFKSSGGPVFFESE